MRCARIVPLTVVLVGVGLGAGTTTAAPPIHETFHDEFTDVDDNFCDEGLNVQIDTVVDGRALVRTRGPEALVYFTEHLRVTNTFTNLDNDATIHAVDRVVFKDLKVIDNGDGTLTVVVLGTGNATLYGADGKAIARNPGQIRFELLIDHGGTPADPEDDVELDFQLIKESTGRTDDFCAAAVPALTG